MWALKSASQAESQVLLLYVYGISPAPVSSCLQTQLVGSEEPVSYYV